MSPRSQALLADALQLPPDEREHLAAELVASLEETRDAEADRAWLELAERRAAQALGGTSGVSWPEMRARIAARRRAT
jgi:putative addiction module component (TIGR02574 family)